MHKKIKILGFFCLALFLFKIDVHADGVKCAYSIEGYTSYFICTVQDGNVICERDAASYHLDIDTRSMLLIAQNFQENGLWKCPNTLYGNFKVASWNITELSTTLNQQTHQFILMADKSSDGGKVTLPNSGNSSTSSNLSEGKTTGCDILGGADGKTVQLLSQVVKFIRLGVPILIIILGITDFMRILFSGEEKVFKEAFSKFIKRLLIGVIIIFLPYILQLLVSLSGIETQYGIDNFFCGIIDATGVKSDSVGKYKTRDTCEAKGYTWIPESTNPNGGFCSKVEKDSSFYKNATSCKNAGYVWNVQNSSCTSSKKISKEDCIASGYIYNTNNQCVLSKGQTGEDPVMYTNFISCNTAGYLWNVNARKCMANTQISQQDCTASGYKVSSSSQGYQCIKKIPKEHNNKSDCEKFGYLWTYNDDDTGYCHT